MSEPPARFARLVLVTPQAKLLGCLPPFPVATPWWQDIAPVVHGARAAHGVEVTVLRLLEAELSAAPGGMVTYLAEVSQPVATEPWPEPLQEHPLRHAYARVGGPAADLAWADAALAERGLARSGPAEQMRTWNLSSLWRLPLEGESAWLKVVPPFFAHEGPLLARLAGGPVPHLLSRAPGRVLLREIPGEDRYGADPETLSQMVCLLVDLQARWLTRSPELLALGLRDFRREALTSSIAAVVQRTPLVSEDRDVLERFVAELPDRFDEIAECGLPDTLIHGDFHPGNLRGHGHGLTLLDWGDSGVGHALLDQSAFLDRIEPGSVPATRARWFAEWQRRLPNSQPERAAHWLAPIAAARQATIYRLFLDNIEPSEHPYHAADPADWLARTAALLRKERRSSTD